MKHVITFLAGLLFSFGLIVSGMINPQKVIDFLDIFGEWDPDLAFVMAGAVSVNFIGFQLVTKRTNPLYADEFSIPTRVDVDQNLVIGASCFGVGWGLIGFCPGPAIAALTAAPEQAAPFILSLLAGMFIARLGGSKAKLAIS